jgi:hypothetical protein
LVVKFGCPNSSAAAWSLLGTKYARAGEAAIMITKIVTSVRAKRKPLRLDSMTTP